MKKVSTKLLLIVLVIVMMLPCWVFAFETQDASSTSHSSITPYSNTYITRATGQCIPLAGGQIKIAFDVYAKAPLNYIGAQSITLFEKQTGSSWRVKSSFYWSNHEKMMGWNADSYASSKTISGTVGYQYYAVVTFWGGTSATNGESRTVTTSTVTARQ